MVSEGHGDRYQEDRRNDHDPEPVETGDRARKRDREGPKHAVLGPGDGENEERHRDREDRIGEEHQAVERIGSFHVRFDIRPVEAVIVRGMVASVDASGSPPRAGAHDVTETQHLVVPGGEVQRHTHGVRRSQRDPATRTVLDAANATFVAVICFALLTGISTQLQNVRPKAPWEVDPYDAAASFAMMIVPIVAALTWVRCIRWRSEAVYPTFALVEIVRGCVVSLLAIAATDAAYQVAVLHRGFPRPAPLRPELLGSLGLSVVTLVVASVMSMTAWTSQRRAHRNEVAPSDEPDAVDDVAELLRTAPPQLAPLHGFCVRTGDLLVAWAGSSASPRRHPWLFVATVSGAAGVAAAASEFVHEGLPPSVGVGILVVALFGAIVVISGLLAYALVGRYLHLVRSPRRA